MGGRGFEAPKASMGEEWGGGSPPQPTRGFGGASGAPTEKRISVLSKRHRNSDRMPVVETFVVN